MVREALQRADTAQEIAKGAIKNATEQITEARLVLFQRRDKYFLLKSFIDVLVQVIKLAISCYVI